MVASTSFSSKHSPDAVFDNAEKDRAAKADGTQKACQGMATSVTGAAGAMGGGGGGSTAASATTAASTSAPPSAPPAAK